MLQTTLCFLVKEDQICLAMKKRGFGQGRWNGIGGKLDQGESIIEATIRELEEEIMVKTQPDYLDKVGMFKFYFKNNPDWNQDMHTYFIRQWQGEPKETEEMRPQWFQFENIPYSKMWVDDIHWLPKVLVGQKLEGEFYFSDEGKNLEKFEVRDLKSL